MLPNKWHRIAISAAGICVEVVLASLCTFLWWFSEPGLLNTLCLNIMVICSISTILFNANPLLRYDGYYILADWLEIPNLQRQSRNLIRHHLIRWFLGFDVDSSRMLPERLQGLIFAYGVGSFLYRWFLLAAILWFCYHVLVPYRLELLASALAVLLIGGGIFAPAWQVIRFFWKSSRNHQVNWMRFGICGGLVALVLLSAVAVPLPYRLVVPAVIEARDARRIYVSVPGRVTPFVRPGDPVAKGQTLACLDNPQLRVEIAELRERRDHQRLLLRNLEHQEIGDRSAAAQIPTVRKALADTQERLQRRLQDQEHLTLTAPIAGTVLPAPRRIDKPVSGELNTWSGTPLQPQNSGGFLETGTLLCLVGDPRQMEATVFIDQADIEFVQVRQKVSMHLDQLPGSTLSGTITQIAELDVETAPHTLVGEREMSARIDHQGRLRPLSAAYQARVKLDPHDHRLLIDMPGRAKIFCSPQSLLSRLYRFVRRTFHL